MPVPIEQTAAQIDFSGRYAQSTAVVASPAAAAETIIAQITVNTDLTIAAGVRLHGWAAYTVGTSGTNVTLRLRRTNVAGTLIASSGGLTRAAASLQEDDIDGFDATPAATGQVYVLTMQVTAGAAASTVSATLLDGWAI